MIRAATAGMSTLEALVAISILGIVGASTSHAIAQAMHIRASSAYRLRAAQFAAEAVECLRSDDRTIPPPPPGFAFAWQSQPLAAAPGVERFRITLQWNHHGEQLFALEGLQWRRP